ncbi:helix-turn-helix domain-containing protein [Sedimenticola hydrogenitrophicus]|uniref:helix-turn-helix domain-containing protein n=1 Tax=Sedimenticola hydrogenitrophicus TaxID=2967975 RepID=UPI0023B1E279|nr:helix-turn-helix domain-containing protein [Sedimenticola hydrogenitrophicus]
MLIHSPKDLAAYYRDLRKARGLSQTEVAEEVVIRQDTVSKFETRPDNVRLDTLFRLLSALELEVHLVPKGESVVEGDKEQWSEPW